MMHDIVYFGKQPADAEKSQHHILDHYSLKLACKNKHISTENSQ